MADLTRAASAEESSSICSQIRLRPPKTSASSPLVPMARRRAQVDYSSMLVRPTIASFPTSWPRAVTSPTTTVKVVSPFTASSSMTRSSTARSTHAGFLPWPTRALTPTVHNSLSASSLFPGSMVSTSSLVKWSTDLICLMKLRKTRTLQANPLSRLSSSTLVRSIMNTRARITSLRTKRSDQISELVST